MRPRRLFFASLAAALVLAACNSPAADNGGVSDDGDLTPVNFRLDWTYGAQHSGYVIADELGYYEEAGLDVDIMEGEGSAVTAQIVSSQQADIGVISAGELLVALDNDFDLQAVATVVQSNPTAIFYDGDEHQLDTLEDLYGLSVGVVHESSQYNEWLAIAALNDLEMDQINEVAAGQAALPSFINGEFETTIGWTFLDGVVAEVEGVNVEFLLFSDFGLEIPNSSLVTNSEFAEAEPEAVEAFIEATARGWEYMEENPEEGLDLFLDEVPEADPEDNEIRLPLFLELTGEEFGAFDSDAWQTLHDLYYDNGLLEDEVELEGHAYTTEFLG